MSDKPLDLSAILAYCQKATPGPWSARPDEDNYGITDEDSWGSIRSGDDAWHIARVWKDGCNNIEADAHLLASSRTDLPTVTEALIEALDLLDWYRTCPMSDLINEAVKQRNKALRARFTGWDKEQSK